MNNTQCSCRHNVKPLLTTKKKQAKKKTWQRFVEFTKMAVPAFVMVLIPKCPVCLAGYIALATGIGLSINTATYVRFGLMVLCVISVSYFVIKHVRKWVMNNN